MFTLWLCDYQLQPIAVIETYESLIWTERYNKAGEFELVTTDVGSWINVIKNDYLGSNGQGVTNTIPYSYSLKKSDTDTVMCIEDFKITCDVEEGNKITITGRSFESRLDRLPVFPRFKWSSERSSKEGKIRTPYGMIKELFERYVLPYENEGAYRWLKFIDTTDSRLTDESLWSMRDFDFEGGTILDALEDICDTYGLGFNILPKTERHDYGTWVLHKVILEFRVYLGRNVSDNVIFSPRFDNFANSEFELSTRDMYTGYVVKLPNLKYLTNNESEWYTNGKTAHYSDSDVGSYIRHDTTTPGVSSVGRTGFIDLSGLTQQDWIDYDMANNLHDRDYLKSISPIVQQEYLQGVFNGNIDNYREEGRFLIEGSTQSGFFQQYAYDTIQTRWYQDSRVRFGFSGSAEITASNYIFGKDYTIGDIVMVENEFGIAGLTQITELVQSFDTQNGYVLLPTFSSFTPYLNNFVQ